MEKTRLLVLAFVHVSENEHYMNRITATVSKNKVFHVELGFENSEFFSILHGQTVHLHFKQLSNQNYELVTLRVCQAQYEKCYSLCKELKKRNIRFDDFGLYSVFCYKICKCFSFTYPLNDTTKTFCSKIITQILQEIDLTECRGLDPNSTTPSDLYEAVKHSNNQIIYSSRINTNNFKLAIPMFATEQIL